MSDLNEIHQRLISAQNRHARMRGQLLELEKSSEILEFKIAQLSSDIQAYGKVITALQATASSFHDKLISSIESLVTQGLRSVIGTDIAFKITSTVRNRQVTLDFYLVSEDGSELDPLDARGGGIAALTGLIMRIVVLRLLSANTRQILILDEPLAHLSSEYVLPAADMLVSLAHRLDVQVLMVTHQEPFVDAADVAYHVSQKDGTAILEKIK